MTSQSSAPTSGTRHQQQDDEIDLLALFGTLWDHKFFIAAITAVFMVLGVAYALLAAPVYRSNAIIQVEEQKPSLPGMDDVTEMFGGESAAVTEIELIKSRAVIGTAVNKLNLDIITQPHYFPVFGAAVSRRFNGLNGEIASPLFGLNSYAWGGEKISVSQFDVPTRLFSEEHTLIAGDKGNFSLYSPDDELILEGQIGQLAQSSGYALYVATLQANPGTRFELIRKRRLSAIIDFQAAVGASERGKDSGIIALSLENTDPEEASNILNVITEAYVRQNVERQSAEAAKSLEFLRDQLPGIKKELEQAESQLNEYQVKVGSVNISAEAEVLLEQVVEIESAIAELQLQKAELDRKYTSDHPAYQAWREQMAEQKSRKAELSTRIKDLPETQQELIGLKRDLEVGTEIYTQMLNNIQELDIVRAGTVGNVRIVDDAAVNIEEPVKPKKALIAVIATLLGGFLGVALVLVRAALNRGIENPEDIEALGLPVYASIPLSDEQRKLDRVDDKGKRLRKAKHLHPNALLAQRNPTDITIESLRSLRTSLHFAMMEAPNNIMMISGPSPNVGKSFVSGNLAAVVAQAGQKVLLIDLDLRKGYMHKMFDTSPENGASDVLSKRISLAEAIKSTKVGELSFLPRGTIPPNPSELLMSQGLSDLLNEVKDQYDLIIVDTPPVMAVTDAAIVGRHCGVTMLVTRFAMNPVKELEVTKQRFEQNGITVKGVVLNAVERRASAYGYGYGYGYYHYEYKSDKT
ncbi:capsular exopolysaccharide biosynthesis protein [Spongiibacter sp. IMCC21906]|uniref:polysaccharide biosynthesis tyrosine autokinase n=1 Tax=Spongiibacter sp. IMCC21906 TaxID=1620392 RepID=UPI00062DF0FC|nr:polysaccharide biosynthesis tyrosine autokinase [Spongiibacter sp. IMCC21906]AKH67859.1 capsular exopolysaccharide biosynthesis protein [Spongiibacter sp. IMCC21906]